MRISSARPGARELQGEHAMAFAPPRKPAGGAMDSPETPVAPKPEINDVDEACRDLALATKLGEELMQQNQALRRSHDEELATLRAQAEEQVAAAKRELEDAERRRERAESASMDAMRAAWAAGADLSPRASGARSAAVGSWTSPPSTPTARSRQTSRAESPAPGSEVAATLEEAMLLEQENEQLASEAAQLASQCAALQVESAEVGDELHSQQLLATRCHALAQRVQSQQDELERGRSRLTELEAMLEHAEQQATTEEQRASRLEATHAALEAAPTAAPTRAPPLPLPTASDPMAAGGWYAESAAREDAAHDDFVKSIEAASKRIVSAIADGSAPPPSFGPLLESSLDDLGAAAALPVRPLGLPGGAAPAPPRRILHQDSGL